jgi:hypothetical protein
MLQRSAFRPRKPPRMRPGPDPKRAPEYLRWLRKLPCYVCWKMGRVQANNCEACHTPDKATRGTSTKVADWNAIPMCGGPQGHHAEQTQHGWKTFAERHDFDPRALAEQYWSEWLRTASGQRWKAKQEGRL